MRRLNQISLRRRWPFWAVLALALLLCIGAAVFLIVAPYRDLDILIVNGTVIDGTGAPARVCDVGIRDHKIVGLSRWEFLCKRAGTIVISRGGP
jgi:hypothetical protein